MNCNFVTRFLFLCLFVVSANNAWACGKDKAHHATNAAKESSEKSCCSKDDAATSCGGDSKHQHSGSDCPCEHEKGGCHCPGCGTVCHSGAAFAPDWTPALTTPIFNFSVQKQAFYFAEHLPEAVYLPIWQPPKIGA